MENSEQQILAAAMERMMRTQEVILKAPAGKLKWWEAAEIMGVTDRTTRRWRQRLSEHGYSALWDYRKSSPSPKSLLCDAEAQRARGRLPAYASGAGFTGTRSEDDPGLFTAGEGAIGAKLRHMAGSSATGTEAARD